MLPSRTAQGVARARALMSRPSTTDGDPQGEERLTADLAAHLPNAPGPLFHHLAARTRFFDDVTLAALDAGTRQIVIVGAGYDCRALRFRSRGVRFFELDQPATQQDKRERLDRLGITSTDVTFVPIDLAAASVDGALVAAGHDAVQRSLFVCEGLLLYLDLAVVERLFRGLRRRVAGDATLALSVGLRDRVVADPAAAARRAILHQRLRRLGEPSRTTLSRAAWEAILATTGWEPERAVDPDEIDAEAPSGGALFLCAQPAEPEGSRSWT
jgi:methyltransferase (TIGR00027 family)